MLLAISRFRSTDVRASSAVAFVPAGDRRPGRNTYRSDHMTETLRTQTAAHKAYNSVERIKMLRLRRELCLLEYVVL